MNGGGYEKVKKEKIFLSFKKDNPQETKSKPYIPIQSKK
tara:strand:- start:712 stop:828 length:117 start_codon:yes stop_codon:yes gene_type:complete